MARPESPRPPPASHRCPDASGRRLASPRTLSPTPSSSSPPLSCSATRARAPPSPPTPFAAATATAPPRRRPRKLRLVPLFILTQTKGAGSPWMPLAPLFPSSAIEDHRRRFAAVFASPSSLRPSPTPLRAPPSSLLLPMPVRTSSRLSHRSRELTAAVVPRRRGQGHRSSPSSMEPCSTPHQEHVAHTRSSSRAP